MLYLPGITKSVLLIDDDPNFLTLMFRAFERVPFISLDAYTNIENVDKPIKGYDLILLDYIIDKKPSWPIIAALRTKHPKIPIMAVTAYCNPRLFGKLHEAGCVRAVTKTIGQRAIIREAKKILKHSKLRDSNNYKSMSMLDAITQSGFLTTPLTIPEND